MTKKSDYPWIEDGEWVELDARQLRHACCDCGLTHDMRFRVRKGKIAFKVERNPFATGGMRRSFQFREAVPSRVPKPRL